MNPLLKFKSWYQEQLEASSFEVPSACCLSSIGLDGFPNSRYVSLKEIKNEKFIITGPITSRKAKELLKTPKASIVFWWPETQRQIRIQGIAEPIPEDLADRYFEGRNTASKILSHVSRQGEPIIKLEDLKSSYELKRTSQLNQQVSRPSTWGGFFIDPIRIEFMEFKESRFHIRELATKVGHNWETTFLQP